MKSKLFASASTSVQNEQHTLSRLVSLGPVEWQQSERKRTQSCRAMKPYVFCFSKFRDTWPPFQTTALIELFRMAFVSSTSVIIMSSDEAWQFSLFHWILGRIAISENAIWDLSDGTGIIEHGRNHVVLRPFRVFAFAEQIRAEWQPISSDRWHRDLVNAVKPYSCQVINLRMNQRPFKRHFFHRSRTQSFRAMRFQRCDVCIEFPPDRPLLKPREILLRPFERL